MRLTALTIALAATAALAATTTARAAPPDAATAAQAAPSDVGRVEIGFSPAALITTSASISPLLGPDAGGYLTGTIRAAYAVHDLVDVHIGYRLGAPGPHTYPSGLNVDTVQHGVVGGARLTWPLVDRWLGVYGLVELEASALDAAVSFSDGRGGSQTAWAFGVGAELGLALRWDMARRFAGVLRLGGGYVLRTDHDLDTLPLEGRDGLDAQALDLGAANASGWLVGATVAFRW